MAAFKSTSTVQEGGRLLVCNRSRGFLPCSAWCYVDVLAPPFCLLHRLLNSNQFASPFFPVIEWSMLPDMTSTKGSGKPFAKATLILTLFVVVNFHPFHRRLRVGPFQAHLEHHQEDQIRIERNPALPARHARDQRDRHSVRPQRRRLPLHGLI